MKINFLPIGPEIILMSVATVLLLLDVVFVRRFRNILGYFALTGQIGALIYSLVYFGARGELIVSQLAIDNLTAFIRIGIIVVSITITLAALKNTYTIQENQGEFFALMLFSVAGTILLAGARDIVTLYIGLELSTIPSFILVAFRKSRAKAAEALMKYFILGLLSAAFLVYGLSLIYGLTGQLNLTKIGTALTTSSGLSPALVVACLMVIAGFGFKIMAIPFHFWAPDAYEGAPVIVVSYIASVPKFGAFAIIARFFVESLQVTHANWPLWFGVLAAVTMTLGNLMALPQNNIKRMMAYSGIAHSGYLLVGLATGTQEGIAAMFFYLVAYAFATIGVFFVISVHALKGEADAISSYTGMAQTNGTLSLAMTLLFLSLIGLPPFAGFFGKVYLGLAAFHAGQWYLAVLIFINSVISVGYYVRVIRAIYLREPDLDRKKALSPFTTSLALGVSSFAIIYLGLIQYPVLSLAKLIYANIKL